MCESEEFRATYAVQGREPVYINPVDAKAKGIKDGDLVRVFNGRGQLLAGCGSDRQLPTWRCSYRRGGLVWSSEREKKAQSVPTVIRIR